MSTATNITTTNTSNEVINIENVIQLQNKDQEKPKKKVTKKNKKEHDIITEININSDKKE